MSLSSALRDEAPHGDWLLATVIALHGAALLLALRLAPLPPVLALHPVLTATLIQAESPAPAAVTPPPPRRPAPLTPVLTATAETVVTTQAVEPEQLAEITPPQQPATEPAEAAAAPAPAAPAAQPEPIQPPRFDAGYLDNPAPAYPPLSRRLREQGTVLLRVQVEASGAAAQVELKQSSGFARLDQTALDTVRRWRFVPARQGGAAVTGWVIVPISFTLRS